MAINGLKNIALAIGCLVMGSMGQMSQAQSVASKLPARPAPVSGRVATDPAPVALRPAAALPTVATSTARQVPPPANPNEPLFKSDVEQMASQRATQPAPVPSAVQGKPHLMRTDGSQKAHKAVGHEHVEKADAPGVRKKKGGHKGLPEKQAKTSKVKAQGGGKALAGTSPGRSATTPHPVGANSATHAHGSSHQAAHQATNKATHPPRHAKTPSASAVSTAHERKTGAMAKSVSKHKGKLNQAESHHKAVHVASSRIDKAKLASAKPGHKPGAKSKKKRAHPEVAA